MLEFRFTRLAQAHMERGGLSESDMLGEIPTWLSEDDPAGAVEQIDRAYRPIGGGWHDTTGGRVNVTEGPVAGSLTFPSDPPLPLIAWAMLRTEQILFFDGAWFVVVQPDATFRTARID